jgi:Fungal specific transcription factor domain
VQIRELEEENEKLKISISSLNSQLKSNADQMQNLQDHEGESFAGHGVDDIDAHDQSHIPVTPVSASEVIAVPRTVTIFSPADKRPPYLSTGDREVHFHGPSSAMFDESSHYIVNTSNSSATANRPKSFELLGACIKQRMGYSTPFHVPMTFLIKFNSPGQMEPIDLAANRLDFDGVDPDLGMHLLSVFWNRQHATGSVVYRPAFMRDMACNGPYFSKILLNAIYFAASKNSTRAEFRCAREAVNNNEDILGLPAIVSPFRRRAEELLSSSVNAGVPVPVAMKSEITTIQALLIMSDALFAWCDERSLSWLYSGLAINMIVDLGIHTDRQTPAMKKDLPAEYFEVRRRLFWAAFGTSNLFMQTCYSLVNTYSQSKIKFNLLTKGALPVYADLISMYLFLSSTITKN